MVYVGRYGRGRGDPTPGLAIVGTIIVIVAIYHFIVFLRNMKSSVGKGSREDKFKNFVKKFKLAFTPFFNKPIDYENIDCFEGMNNVSYYNVVEQKDDNGVIYIGELKWTLPDSVIAASSAGNSDESAGDRRLQHYGTLLLLRNEGFRIPIFSMMDETTMVKAKEVLRLNSNVDIDFDNDDKFSDAWWLSSIDSDGVRKLFTPGIRSCFMKYANKGYIISGKDDTLFVLTEKVLDPGPAYLKLINDAKQIHQFLKKNKNIYKETSDAGKPVDEIDIDSAFKN